MPISVRKKNKKNPKVFPVLLPTLVLGRYCRHYTTVEGGVIIRARYRYGYVTGTKHRLVVYAINGRESSKKGTRIQFPTCDRGNSIESVPITMTSIEKRLVFIRSQSVLIVIAACDSDQLDQIGTPARSFVIEYFRIESRAGQWLRVISLSCCMTNCNQAFHSDET